MMKLCFNAGPEPLEEYFPFAHENGCPWMELSCNNPKNFLDKFDATRIDNLGFGKYPNVITNVQMEELAQNGVIKRPMAFLYYTVRLLR